jgi:hypothetical protein
MATLGEAKSNLLNRRMQEISQSRKAHRGLKRIGRSWMLVGNWFVKMASLKVETAYIVASRSLAP